MTLSVHSTLGKPPSHKIKLATLLIEPCGFSGSLPLLFCHILLQLIVKNNRALNETPSQSYGMSLAICDHTVLPATRHKRTHQATGRYSIYLPRKDGRLSWPRWLVTIPIWFTRPQTVTHPSTNLTVHRRELNWRTVDHKSEALTTTPPSHLVMWLVENKLMIMMMMMMMNHLLKSSRVLADAGTSLFGQAMKWNCVTVRVSFVWRFFK